MLGLIVLSSTARAYDEYSHEWITRSALDYLRDHSHVYPETDVWVRDMGLQRGFAEDALVRSVVDTDYRPDLWLKALFHAPFVGAESGGTLALFTCFFHFLNVTTPGDYWEHDGYAYRHSTKQGYDRYLDLVSVGTAAQVSTALGGAAPEGMRLPSPDLGTYDEGFNGTQKEWKKMFDGGPASRVVFPPSTVPAQIAYGLMLQSDRAGRDKTDVWTVDLPVITGLVATRDLKRSYWRGEIAGLPRAWDQLGIALHLTQDATVPHHVEGTSDNCHREYEAWLDQLTCGSRTAMDHGGYYDGTYSGYREGCGQLYDGALVARILNERPDLAADSDLSVAERMVQVAEISAQWKWRTAHGHRYTQFPGSPRYKAKTCSGLLSIQAVRDQAKYQYNLAIAETAALFEKAAHEYESAHRLDPPAQLADIAHWFEEQ